MIDKLGGGLLDLIALQPKYALSILKDPSIKLPDHFFEYLNDDLARSPTITPKERDKDVAACLAVLLKHPAVDQKAIRYYR